MSREQDDALTLALRSEPATVLMSISPGMGRAAFTAGFRAGWDARPTDAPPVVTVTAEYLADLERQAGR